MDGAIWAIFYDLLEEDRDAYLDWFHDVHIPEKLARPGYVSAGHYEVVSADGKPASVSGSEISDGAAGFVALFGGKDTSVFLNPSPAQIKPNQTQETRTMVGQRIGSRSFIAAREWVFEADRQSEGRNDHAIVLSCCDAPGEDEGFGAWCVQDLRPTLAAQTGFRGLSKYLTAVGAIKHVTLASYASLESTFASLDQAAPSDWSARVSNAQTQISGSPFVARRIWPAL